MKNELSGRSSPADHQAMIKKILERMHTEVDSIEESIFGRMEKISNRLNTLDSSIDSLLNQAGLRDADGCEQSLQSSAKGSTV